MKLKRHVYNTIKFIYGEEEAQRVAKLTGWRSLWWQFTHEIGPQAELLHTIFKLFCCAAIGAIIGSIPVPIILAIAAIIILLSPLL